MDIVGRRTGRLRRVAGNGLPGGAQCHYDIPYTSLPGVDPGLTSLDIYSPDEMGFHPILVYVHGGGWRNGDKRNVGKKPNFFVEEGYLFISVNHRLTPSAWFPAHLKDLASSISWVMENAGHYGGDTTNIFLMGSSSGAHLVSTLAMDGSYLAGEDLRVDILRGVISIDTRAYDIPFLMSNLPLGGGRLYRNTFGSNETAWEKASPIHYIGASQTPPILIAYSDGDPNRKKQAERFASRLEDDGHEYTLIPAPGKKHLDIIQDIGRPGDPVSQKILEFLQGNELR